MAWQQYLPIMEEGKNQILGLLDLGENVEFFGTEVEYELPDAAPDADNNVALEKFTPTPSAIREVAPWFMVARFTHDQVIAGGHRGYSCFVPLKDVLPSNTWSSGSGLANVPRQYNGPVLEGLTRRNGFGTGVIPPDSPPPPDGDNPIITVPPVLDFGRSEALYPFFVTTFPEITGYDPGYGGDYGIYYVKNDAPLPIPGETVDWDNVFQHYAPSIRPAEDEAGDKFSFFVAIYNTVDYLTFDYVYPVFVEIESLGAVGVGDIPPVLKDPTHDDPAIRVDSSFWSIEYQGSIYWWFVGTETVTYQWYKNDVLQVGPAWENPSMSKAFLSVGGGVVPGDELYMVETITDDRGTSTRTSQTLVATTENLAYE